jgi:hypothetical protein
LFNYLEKKSKYHIVKLNTLVLIIIVNLFKFIMNSQYELNTINTNYNYYFQSNTNSHISSNYIFNNHIIRIFKNPYTRNVNVG